ncbi:bacteriochlorophyll 4-vinyl reductase [Jannaschia seohaensis]|uniref:Divinyl protochlorophyllide a 8-vinyl-reductase n=1 Tax=Jannaschia seohaensis TaxID=475081 RepID=A0A2Y9AU30_9RHOB|nr:bacteriochlorophyll 4-vinyl reductase [Jannaschia seohaensis]PWJ19335.1 divinyl protochlorophyllide a 8-vinyl-reductase [Jannaschia seohaensis]SSA45997.1 divinyl protochlorophyllide a 8-vinyl-reductase [Jannaschia seohaensis]
MSEDVRSGPALIGPNAILQMLPVLDRLGGPERRGQILARAGIFDLPDGTRMIPETQAAQLHRTLRQEEPILAPALAGEAGRATADYILAHRIPRPAQLLLRVLPAGPSAALLSRAIARHAWTFVGSGRFRVVDPMTFEIADNPLVAGERSEGCLCHWHAAVFARLYHVLVAADATCTETSCGAHSPGHPCRFELERSGSTPNLIDIKPHPRAAQ